MDDLSVKVTGRDYNQHYDMQRAADSVAKALGVSADDAEARVEASQQGRIWTPTSILVVDAVSNR